MTSWRRGLRRAAWVLAGLALFCGAWWGWLRAGAGGRATAAFELVEIPAGRWRGGPVVVACSNIAHGRGLADQHFFGADRAEQLARLEELVEALRAEAVDVLVLNEVDFDASWSARTDQARWLAREAGYRFVVEHRQVDTGVPGYRLQFGNAVLSRFPLEVVEAVEFPRHRPLEHAIGGSKQGLLVRVTLAPGRSFLLSPVHFENRDAGVRLRSAQALAAAAAAHGEPTLLAGDFNSTRRAWPGEGRKHLEQTAVEWLFEEAGFSGGPLGPPTPDECTFRADAPNRVIDWILHDAGFEQLERRALPLRFADHRPVVASMRLVTP